MRERHAGNCENRIGRDALSAKIDGTASGTDRSTTLGCRGGDSHRTHRVRKPFHPNRQGKTDMATAAVNRIKRRLPERIAQVRGDRSQRQFARDLGVFQQNVNRYENGTTPHTDFLITLATKEGVSLDWLLLGKGRMKKSSR
jgi:hypothetical protein